LAALSDFREFLEGKGSLEPLGVIFGVGSPEGVFGRGMGDLSGGTLTGVSRSWQSAILKQCRLTDFKGETENESSGRGIKDSKFPS